MSRLFFVAGYSRIYSFRRRSVLHLYNNTIICYFSFFGDVACYVSTVIQNIVYYSFLLFLL